ncbi:uncharacterized protein LOC127262376 [Andrographis paniculata]|uniref:uncharacterized protein LOC127262376 n=1 Tax=Andrographis paniculata TaxID=175694 RepID=UPI0021E6FE72|nr:uncharacterized protein LOC127262376 [Andrographis paniculata]
MDEPHLAGETEATRELDHGTGVKPTTDGWISDELSEEDRLLRSPADSNDTRGPAYEEWDDEMDESDCESKVGMKFVNRLKYKQALRDWAVRRGWNINLIKNEKKKVTPVCKKGCDWRIHASSIMGGDTFQIKTLKGTHQCSHQSTNAQANYKYLGRRIKDMVADNPDISILALKKKIRREVRVEVTMYKVYRAKQHALELIKGSTLEQYKHLYDYCVTVCKFNPSSSCILSVDWGVSPPVLKRMYYCLAALREGCKAGCRTIIGLDGCFLRGIYKGQLLTAVGRDPNENIYPIAFAFVEIEKYETWDSFLERLLRDLGDSRTGEWFFISDRQKGLVETIAERAPGAEHRFCLRHMYNSFKVWFKGLKLKRLFWKAVSTFNLRSMRK